MVNFPDAISGAKNIDRIDEKNIWIEVRPPRFCFNLVPNLLPVINPLAQAYAKTSLIGQPWRRA